MGLSLGQVVVLAVAALLVFWMVGAYNRLMALRNAIAGAWRAIDAALQRRAAAVASLVQALREPLAAEQRALDVLLSAQAQASLAAEAMATGAPGAGAAEAWVAAESALAAAASRVLALLEQHPGLRDEAPVVADVAAWHTAEAQLAYTRQAYDGEVLAYNAALAQVPTCWLTRVFGFAAVGRLRG